jgi:hypothetical protein
LLLNAVLDQGELAILATADAPVNDDGVGVQAGPVVTTERRQPQYDVARRRMVSHRDVEATPQAAVGVPTARVLTHAALELGHQRAFQKGSVLYARPRRIPLSRGQ